MANKNDERFMRALKNKIHYKMTTNSNNCYCDYLDGLVDRCNNNYHGSVGKQPANAGYSALIKEIELNNQAPNLVLMIKWELLINRIFLAKDTQDIHEDKYVFLIMCWMLNLGLIRLKIWKEKEYYEDFIKWNFGWLSYK